MLKFLKVLARLVWVIDGRYYRDEKPGISTPHKLSAISVILPIQLSLELSTN